MPDEISIVELSQFEQEAPGKTIAEVKSEVRAGRVVWIGLRFTDGSEWTIDYFAVYADDCGLTLDREREAANG